MHLLLGLDRPIYALVSTINWPFWTSYALTHKFVAETIKWLERPIYDWYKSISWPRSDPADIGPPLLGRAITESKLPRDRKFVVFGSRHDGGMSAFGRASSQAITPGAFGHD